MGAARERVKAGLGGDLNRALSLHTLWLVHRLKVLAGAPNMTTRASVAALAVAGLSFVTACGSNPKPQAPAVPTPAKQVAPQVPLTSPLPPDPIATLIATSRRYFEAGERQLALGHPDRARVEFDRAVDVMLESPYGARTDARTREYFDRLVDRVYAYEVTALAQGDGFAETRSEPASIDKVLEIATFPQPAADETTTKAVKADLAATAHDIPIPQNSRVLAYVESMEGGRLREFISDGLTRGTKYLPMIQAVFRAEGLPLDLAYIPIIESGFKTNALSKASAKGHWQFMKPTAKENGLHFDWYVDERSDPEKATVAAAKYLKTLHKMFHGDWNLVLAAYNGGLGRLQRAMKKSGKTDFWALSDTSKYLPKETREYVPLILAAIIVAKNPVQYGFDIIAQAPVAYDKVRLPRAMDLRRVAEWTGASIDDIQSLNPALRRWTTPVKAKDFTLNVPVGTGEQFQARLADASAGDLAGLKWYTVRRGESIPTIARKLKVNRVDLAEANSLSVRSRLRAGSELIIPRAPATLLASRTERAAPAEVASRALGGSATVPSPAVRRPQSQIVYRVKRGDTLFAIAELFDTTVATIKSMNKLRGNVITAGARLKIVAARVR